MNFNFQKFCDEQNIHYITGGHKHAGNPGWINMPCPLCTGNPGYHLGFNIKESFFHCWRCGTHAPYEIISSLLSCSGYQAFEFIKQYQGRVSRKTEKEMFIPAKYLALPNSFKPLSDRHKKYLYNRKFDPDLLEETWGLKGSGPVGLYKHRIIAPIYFQHRLISFQGRDITEKSKAKYLPCLKENEVREHQKSLYGFDKVYGNSSVLVVEGITDVWRLGPGAVCTFGVDYTMSQILLLKNFRKVYVFFDSDPQGIAQAKKLCNALSGVTKSIILKLKGVHDPGDLTQNEADKLMKKLKFDIF